MTAQETASLHIFTLGGLRLRRDGHPFDGFSTRKAAALLIYLAATRRPQPRELLAELLWDDRSQTVALTNLRVALSDLRKHAGDVVVITRQTAALADDASVWLDAAAITDALAGPIDDFGRLAGALTLYHGDFLAGFYLRDASGFEAWVTAERERLHQQALAGFRQLAQHYLAARRFADGIAVAQRRLWLDPLAEDAHRQLMHLLAADGQTTAALAQFERCRELLANELGVEPEAETAALAAAITAGTAVVPPAPAETTPRHNLPGETTPFFGRTEEIATLERLRDEPTARLISLVGAGGMGKTRLAVAAAYRFVAGGYFEHGVFFVPLTAVDHPAQVVMAAAEALGVSLSAEIDPEEQLTAYLRHKQMCLILDNFEQIRDGAALIARLLTACANLVIVVTSRERLRLRAEHVLLLRGLPYEEQDDATTPAAALFIATARRVNAGFQVDLEAINRICRLVEGMPLALQLAAAWVDTLSPQTIADALSGSLDLLAGEAADLPPRQQNMRAVFEASWRRLTPSEQHLLASCSCFRGGFTRDAVAAVCGATAAQMAQLIHRSMLVFDSDSDRYQMHELLRQYAADQLASMADLRGSTGEQHSRYFIGFAARQAAELGGPRQEAALARLDADSENIHLAWQWACRHDPADSLTGVLPVMSQYFIWRHRYQEAVQWLDEAIEQMPATAPELASALFAARGFFQTRLKQYTAASQAQAAALALSPAEPLTHFHIGHIYLAQGQTSDSRLHFEQALAAYRAAGDQWGEAQVLTSLADLSSLMGNYGEAQRQFEAALDLFQAQQELRSQAHVQERLSHVLRDRGQMRLAEQHIKSALSLYRALDDQEKLADCTVALSWVLLYMGRYGEAQDAVEQGAAILSQWDRPLPLGLLGIVYTERGSYARAQALLHQHVAECRKKGDAIELAQALSILANIAVIQGDCTAAQSLLSESIPILESIGQRDRLSHAQAWWGYAARCLGQTEEAWHYFRQVLETGLQIQGIMPLVFALPGVALLLADSGDYQRAAEIHLLLQTLPMVSNSQMRHDLAGAELSMVARQLPPETMALIHERITAADIWEVAGSILAAPPAPSPTG